MKSRFEVLKTPAERRNFAIVRSSGAVAIVLSLVAIAYLAPASQAPRHAASGQLLAMEVGVLVEPRVSVAPQAAPADHGAAVVARRSTPLTDEFSFSSTYSGEPGRY